MNWQYKIDINHTIRTVDIDDVADCRQKLADAIRLESKKLPEQFHPKFEDFAVAVELCEDIEEMRIVMEDIYDFADDNAIWLGL